MAKAGGYEDYGAWGPPDIETIRYELERFHAQTTFCPEVIHQVRAESYRHEVTKNIVWHLMGVVALWREQRLLKVPANWWEHFKQRWFPRWALKRWPVLFTWYDAAVVLPKVPVIRPEYHMVEFPVFRETPTP